MRTIFNPGLQWANVQPGKPASARPSHFPSLCRTAARLCTKRNWPVLFTLFPRNVSWFIFFCNIECQWACSTELCDLFFDVMYLVACCAAIAKFWHLWRVPTSAMMHPCTADASKWIHRIRGLLVAAGWLPVPTPNGPQSRSTRLHVTTNTWNFVTPCFYTCGFIEPIMQTHRCCWHIYVVLGGTV